MAHKQLSIEEREEIQELLWQKKSVRTIAKELGRSSSSISREIKKNTPLQHKRYTPRKAHERAIQNRSCRGRENRLKNDSLRNYVHTHLKLGWSPEQIAGCIEAEIGETLSHEAIYQYIYAQFDRQGYGKLKNGREDLRIYLKRRHKRRVPKGARKSKRICKPPMVSIDNRPTVVDTRSRIGDWESDSVASCDNASGINTLVERKSGLVLISRLVDKTSACTAEAIIKRLSVYPRYTITFDNGSENHAWRDIRDTLDCDCYFAHPYHSWERGTNENTNGLIRWYFPKGTDFRIISDTELAYVEYQLNTRPRKRHGFRSPLTIFNENMRSDAIKG